MVTLSDTRQSRQTTTRLSDRLVAGFLILIPVVLFWYVWAQYAVNVPKWDDHALKVFLTNLDAESSVWSKLARFFQQHNEHRIVYDRLVTWLDFTLSGKLNYRHLMIIGNLSLLGLLVVFGQVLGRSVDTQQGSRSINTLASGLSYLPPIAFLILNLSHWENMFWGMAALQNFTVMLWVIWAIYSLSFTFSIGPALLLATAATLTSGNGLLIWPVGFALLLSQLLLKTRTSYKPLIIWTGSAVIATGLYFLNYKKPAGNPPVRGSFAELVQGWFAFNGAAAEAFPLRIPFTLCLLLGGFTTIVVLGAWLIILRKALTSRRLSSFDYFFAATTIFLLGTAATVTWSRVGFGMNTLITSRYKIYSLVLLAVVYSYAIIQGRSSYRRWLFYGGLMFSVTLMASSYRTYLDETIGLRQWLLTKQFNWTYATNRPVSAIDPQTARLIDNSPAFYDSVLPHLYQPATGPPAPFTSVQKSQNSFSFSDTTALTPAGPDAGTYVLARSAKRIYLFPTLPTLTSSWRASVGLQPLFRKGVSGSVSEGELAPGTYQLDRLTVHTDGTIDQRPTGQTITAATQVQRDIPKNW